MASFVAPPFEKVSIESGPNSAAEYPLLPVNLDHVTEISKGVERLDSRDGGYNSWFISFEYAGNDVGRKWPFKSESDRDLAWDSLMSHFTKIII